MKGVLFDLDGVITSERIYWNCSGLALAKYMGKKMPNSEAGKVKLAQKLLPDSIIRGFKEAGINSNWDITYASSIVSKLGRDAKWFQKELKKRGYKGLDYLKLLDEIDQSQKHKREGGEWKEAHKKFQACHFELEHTDETVIPLAKVKKALKELKALGLKIGIATGRPLGEVDKPLKKWGLWDYFEPAMIITDDDAAREETRIGRHVGKPDPWIILCAISRNERCSIEEAKKFAGEYLYVGDSVADVLAAKNAGTPLICVNTGIASKASLKAAGATTILKDISFLPAALKKT